MRSGIRVGIRLLTSVQQVLVLVYFQHCGMNISSAPPPCTPQPSHSAPPLVHLSSSPCTPQLLPLVHLNPPIQLLPLYTSTLPFSSSPCTPQLLPLVHLSSSPCTPQPSHSAPPLVHLSSSPLCTSAPPPCTLQLLPLVHLSSSPWHTAVHIWRNCLIHLTH